ncbi:cupin domain-containing protein [Arenimonas oryziterrae]|uniref:ChrR-like cupin domain-containing protein n=1 Tax=Arenimonas oryziterrae DSM 21050 = YC6267 TaxID=1121015 RepID=A0A091APK1_9GAMM|nr:cupin domain-containing protein [Arenimonas oryziterrae]KFN41057.1 hypothetical protein N789_04010 [Arenimonas oryziterrae DSM 21050 = YC6267]
MSERSTHDALLLAAMAGLLPEQGPADAVRERLRVDILQRAGAAPINVIRRDEGEWRDLLPGVQIKTLRRDAQTQTTLWRVQPGGRVPPHVHAHEEECLVLEGRIVHDGVSYFSGDYLLARAGESHRVFEAPEGALFLIRGEPIPDPAVLARLPR